MRPSQPQTEGTKHGLFMIFILGGNGFSYPVPTPLHVFHCFYDLYYHLCQRVGTLPWELETWETALPCALGSFNWDSKDSKAKRKGTEQPKAKEHTNMQWYITDSLTAVNNSLLFPAPTDPSWRWAFQITATNGTNCMRKKWQRLLWHRSTYRKRCGVAIHESRPLRNIIRVIVGRTAWY